MASSTAPSRRESRKWTPRSKALASDTAMSTHILQDMWEKWMMIASVGGITCLLNGNIGNIVATPGGADLSLAILRECSDIARACGYPPSELFLQQQSPYLTAPGSQLTSSMYRDQQEGRARRSG